MKWIISHTVQSLRCGCLQVDDHLSIATPALVVPLTLEQSCSLTPHELTQLNVSALAFDGRHLLARPGPRVIAQQGGLAQWTSFAGLTIVEGIDVLSSFTLRYRSPYDGSDQIWDEARLTQARHQLAAHLWAVGSQVSDLGGVTLRYARVTTDWMAWVTAIEQGSDLIYCSLPHQWAAKGRLIVTAEQALDLTDARYATDQQPVSEACDCFTCQHYSRAYLYQLHQQGLAFGQRLNLIHNLQYFIGVTQNLRNCLEQGKLPNLR